MSGYTPVFDSVFEGTLCGRWPTLPVWLTILPMADKNGLIDKTLRNISLISGWPEGLLQQAIDELMLPDPQSRSEVDDGRRLVLIDSENRSWGWRVVNHSKYREKGRKAAYDAERVASGQNAERMKARPAMTRDDPRSPAITRADPLSDSDSDSDSDTNKNKTKNLLAGKTPPSWFEEFKQVYPKRAGDQQWRKAISNANARITEGHQPNEFIAGAARYAVFITATGKGGTEYVQQAARFLGPGKPFLLPWNPPAVAESATDEIKRLNGGSHEGRVFEAEPSRTDLVPLFGNVRR